MTNLQSLIINCVQESDKEMDFESYEKLLGQITEARFSEIVLYRAFYGVNNGDSKSRQLLLSAIAENTNIQRIFLIADKETDFHD